MKASELFFKTRKEAPKDEVSKNAQLLIRAGFVDKVMAGVYTFLPLGLRVMRRIENIIREEMNATGGQEVLMPSLHPKENWVKTGRWETMDDLFKVKDASDREFALGPTHEEIVAPLAKQYISSYKDLPLALYQFQNKFRMELRAKSGILRGKEFIMKDLYSFHASEDDLGVYYSKMMDAYKTIFTRVGLGEQTHLTYASGGSFSKYSHEFQTVTDAGEDIIYVCTACSSAINKEIKDEQPVCPACGKADFKEEKSIEVGNIFELKTKFSDPFELSYKDDSGKVLPVIMGCYGIGLGRLMGTVAEVLSDEKGLVWPHEIAPFDVYLVEIGGEKNSKVRDKAEAIYGELTAKGIEVLYDNRDIGTGAKFADAELIGIPNVIVVSDKLVDDPRAVELKSRTTGASVTIDFAQVPHALPVA